jgi:hypothetical protein
MRAGFPVVAALLAGCPYEGVLGSTAAEVTSAWKAEYFDNHELAGTPQLRDEEMEMLYFDWGGDGPIPDFPVDHFSARFTRTIGFQEGTYRFTTRSDDGVRVWVDDQPVIDQWHLPFMAAVDRELTAGNHTVKVEYREQDGSALLQLSWPVVSSTLCTALTAEESCKDASSACQWFACASSCLPKNTVEPLVCACSRFESVRACDDNHDKGCGWFECKQKCLVTGMSIYSVCGEGSP